MGLWLAICVGLCSPAGQPGLSPEQELMPVLEYLGGLSDGDLEGLLAASGTAQAGTASAKTAQADAGTAETMKAQVVGGVHCNDNSATCAENPKIEGAVSRTPAPAGAVDAAL